MNKEKARALLESVSPTYFAVADAVDEALEPDGDGKFAEKDPYARLVLRQAADWLATLRHLLIMEAHK